MPDVERKLQRCHLSLSKLRFYRFWSGSMASVVCSLIIPLLRTERFSFHEYFKLERATASTDRNELMMVLGLFSFLSHSARLSLPAYNRQSAI